MREAASLIAGSCGINSRCEYEETRAYTLMWSVPGFKNAVSIVPREYYLGGCLR